MYDKSQLMRGTLEGCILKILSKNTSYGYEIVTTLLGYGFKDKGRNHLSIIGSS